MKIFLRFLLICLVISGCQKSGSTSGSNNPGSADERSTGASANELLSATKYKSLKVEILYMTGFAPDAAAVTNLQTMLQNLLNKPDGISVVTKEITPSANTTLSLNDVIQIENSNRSAFTSDSTIAVDILYTNGYYTNSQVLGVAYLNTSLVLFGGNIHANSGGVGQASRTKLESTVLEHEFGHLLGLVDLGSPMQTAHKDAANGNHCNNSNCLMYYATDTNDILGFLITGSIPTFDANCMADLQANGAK